MRNSKAGMKIMILVVAMTFLTAVSGCAGDLPVTKAPHPTVVDEELPPSPSIEEPHLENPPPNYDYWYKGQVHTHSSRQYSCVCVLFWCWCQDDGKDSPTELLDTYWGKGYHFVALTGHNQPCDYIHDDPGVAGVIYIPSEEDRYADPEHMLCIGLTRTEDPCGPKEDWDAQERIDHVIGQEAVAVLAHPYDDEDPWDPDLILNELYGFHGLEIYNAGQSAEQTEDTVELWDSVLSNGVSDVTTGRRVWGFAVDDCHNVHKPSKFNRGWIVVNSDKGPPEPFLYAPDDPDLKNELRDDIIQNIKAGNFYAVVRSPEITGEPPSDGPGDVGDIGPRLEIRAGGDAICVFTDQKPEMIEFWGETSRILDTVLDTHYHTESGRFFGCYHLNGSEDYVRVVVKQLRDDGEWYWLYSQPLFVMKQGFQGVVTGRRRVTMPGQESEVPIEGVRITFVSQDGSITVQDETDSAGYYHVHLPKDGGWVEYNVTATHPDYEDYSSEDYGLGQLYWVVTGDGFPTRNISMTRKPITEYP